MKFEIHHIATVSPICK